MISSETIVLFGLVLACICLTGILYVALAGPRPRWPYYLWAALFAGAVVIGLVLNGATI